jgi:hypothetical protein
MEHTPYRNLGESDQQPSTAETEDNPLVSGADEPAPTPPTNGAIMATVVDEPPVRLDSPFAANTATVIKQRHPAVDLQDVGSFHYAAMGGVVAGIMLLGFAIGGLVWFPAGGCVIAALGCAVATLGLHSGYKRSATGILVLHVSLFVACFGNVF